MNPAGTALESNWIRVEIKCTTVQYHNPEGMGGPYRRSGEDFAILTNKDFDSLIGSTVWLVTSKGQRPRRYFLCSSFIVDRVERGNRGRFKNRSGITQCSFCGHARSLRVRD